MGEVVEESIRFTLEDFEDIEEKIEHVKGVSPSYQTYGSARSQKGEFTAYVYGGTVAQQYIYTSSATNGVVKQHKALWFERGNQAYVIMYSAPVDKYETNLPAADYIIQHIKIN